MTNLKLVLRTYSALRQMSPDDIALLETLRGLNDGDRELMVETLQGKATGKKAGKKSTSKSSQPSSKSPRASGIQAQLKERRQEQKQATGDIEEKGEPDIFDAVAELRSQVCTTCGGYEDFMDHHQPSPHYHPFRPAAPSAPVSSPANGGVGSTTVNSEIVKDAASNVAHGASGGD